MRVWRLQRAKHAATVLAGQGARLVGGRWNPAGRAVVYTSATLSLAALEALVQFDVDIAPRDYLAFEIDVPDDLDIAELGPLPPDWRAIPAPASTAAAGQAWLEAAAAAVLAVPSVVVAHERNYLLNPAHPGMAQISAVSEEPFFFDPRLF